MKTTFSELENCTNKLILHVFDIMNIGLLNGQTGILLTLIEYSEKYDLENMKYSIDFIFQKIYNQLYDMTDTSFSNGLSGILWGIEFLIQNGYLDYDRSLDIEKFDKIIGKEFLKTYKSDKHSEEIKLLWDYFHARIQGNMIRCKKFPFNKRIVERWRKIMSAHPTIFLDEEYRWLDINCMPYSNPSPLKLSKYVKSRKDTTGNDYSLQHGLAGYIITKYIDKI